MPSVICKTSPDKLGGVRSWLDWYEVECRIVQGPFVLGELPTWKFIFPENYDSAASIVKSLLADVGVDSKVVLSEHLSPFHDTLGDVPFDGINGCENPFA